MVGTLKSYCFGMVVTACVGITEPALGQPSQERRFREFAEGPLVLSFDPNSAADQFQFEVRVRLVDQDGSTIEQRSVAERSGDKAAVLFLSPNGFPASLVLEKTFLVVASKEIEGFHGGHFSFHAGIIPQGGMGMSMPYSNDASRNSRITLDLAELARRFMVDGAEVTWDEGTASYSVATPGGARLFVYLERDAEPARFPIRAVLATGWGRSGTARIEIAISNIHVGCTPPRTLFRMAGWDDLPLVPASFAQIKASDLNSLGASFDEDDQAACRMGAKLLRKFLTQKSLVVADAELNRVRGLVDSLESATEPEVRDALRELRGVGTWYVWWGLQGRDTPSGRWLQLDYDRFKAAGHTEIAFGPLVTRMLRQQLAAIVTRRDFSLATRCEALDLVGQFGLPLLSPVMVGIEKSLAEQSEEELQVVLSSVRVRYGLANDEDVGRLHRTVAENRVSPEVVTQAIEALAIIAELEPHAERLASFATGERAEASEEGVTSDQEPVKSVQVPRRIQALAADPAGQRILLDLLERGSEKLPTAVGITALLDALTPADEAWQRLLRFCREVALNTQRTVQHREAANRVVHRDGKALASGYSEEFFQSALESGQVSLITPAMTNMVMVGEDTRCYETIQSLLGDTDPARRSEYATTLAIVGAFQRVHGQRLPSSFWTALDKVFADSDPRVRVAGLTTIAVLLGADSWIPTSYVKPLVETALESQDPAHLAITCAALISVTRSDYKPSFAGEASTGPEFLEWVRQHAAEVREHLRDWYAGWQKRQWQPPPPANENGK